MMNEAANWDSMDEAARAINAWANRTFPGRGPKSSVNKLGMEEIPELLLHLKKQGPEGIAGEWADCMILLLDLAVIWGIDPSTAIWEKMIVNNNRMWAKDHETGFYNHVVVQQAVDQSQAEEVRK